MTRIDYAALIDKIENYQMLKRLTLDDLRSYVTETYKEDFGNVGIGTNHRRDLSDKIYFKCEIKHAKTVGNLKEVLLHLLGDI